MANMVLGKGTDPLAVDRMVDSDIVHREALDSHFLLQGLVW